MQNQIIIKSNQIDEDEDEEANHIRFLCKSNNFLSFLATYSHCVHTVVGHEYSCTDFKQ